MLEILAASPIETGALSICFDRRPSLFDMAELKYSPVVYVGFFRGSELVGYALFGIHEGHVNGRPEPVCHFTDLYVDPTARHRGFFYLAWKTFAELRTQPRFSYSVVMQGNRAAQALISRRHGKFPAVPYSETVAELDARTIVITFPRRLSRKFSVRNATMADIDAIVALLDREYRGRLFGPVVDRTVFLERLRRPGLGLEGYHVAERAGKIVGVCAAWDCGAFKQNRVVRYGMRLRAVRMLFGALTRVTGLPALPRAGESFRDVHLTDWAVEDRDPEILEALIRKVYAAYRAKKYNSIVLGSYAGDPLLTVTDGFTMERLHSDIVLASTEEEMLREGRIDVSRPYIDVALL